MENEGLMKILNEAQAEIFRLRNENERLEKIIQEHEKYEKELWKAFGNFCVVINKREK